MTPWPRLLLSELPLLVGGALVVVVYALILWLMPAWATGGWSAVVVGMGGVR